MEEKTGVEGYTSALVWLVKALEYACAQGQSKNVSYLETIADDVVFETEMAARVSSCSRA